MLEELELLADSKVSDSSSDEGESREIQYTSYPSDAYQPLALDCPYLTTVAFKDLQEFQQHLQDKGKSIIARAERFINRLATHRGEVSPDVGEFEAKINTLLAAKKDFMLKLDRLSSEKDQLSEQLNVATLRYFKAEKRLDRAKSVQVQKLEQQAFTRVTQPSTATGSSAEPEAKNGNVDNTEMIAKYEEATAAASKQKEQLDKFLAEIRTLQEENSTLKARKETWTDEDFIRTDVFKQFKSQNEDLIRRINNLEATNKQLREDAEKLQAERLAFKSQLEADANHITQELEAEIVSRDQDLARVRSARDEILAENTQRKASMDQEKLAVEQIKDLVAAKEDRITALESKLSRLESSGDASTVGADDVEGQSPEELQQKYKKLLVDFQSINQELPSIEKAYKKMKDLAQKKVMDFAALEERTSVLLAEKSKADQKYFAARKDADTRNSEIRSLRLQNSKSAEIIAQLKDLESQSRATLSNLEKQLADLRQTNASLATENKKVETSSQDTLRRADTLNKQISDLTSLVKSKDSATAMIKERNTVQETEVEKLKVRIENAQKDRDYWKGKALSNHSVEEEGLRVSFPSSRSWKILANKRSVLPSARYARRTSRTGSSKRVVTCSARTASKIESATACANVLLAPNLSTKWTSCRPTINMIRGVSSSFDCPFLDRHSLHGRPCCLFTSSVSLYEVFFFDIALLEFDDFRRATLRRLPGFIILQFLIGKHSGRYWFHCLDELQDILFIVQLSWSFRVWLARKGTTNSCTNNNIGQSHTPGPPACK